MPAIKKSELYARLWKSCDDLRGGMDASEYKNYILILLFVKYISDKFKNEPFGDIIIPKGCSFDDMSKLKGQDGIGEKINVILDKLGKENEKLKPIFDAVNFNDPSKLGSAKEIKDKLTGLISNFESDDLDFRHNRANDDDVLGDAYEYLMRMFATESGKSKGQFYTPAEVSRVLAKVVKVSNVKSKKETLYDPACGSGSLLIRAAEESPYELSIYGQESETTTAGLANMNMVIHGFSTANIMHGNTLANPKFTENDSRLKQFDYIVMNPPFSLKSWTKGFTNNTDNTGKKGELKDKFGRFKTGFLPPEKNGDYAWMLHVIHSLKQKGRAAIILPHGVLFRGNAEGDLRKYFIDHGFIEGIIGLPTNLFYGTGIAASIVILDKADAGSRQGIFMINASSGFVKDGSKNRLREQDIRKITDAYLGELEIPNFSRFVSNDEIIKTNEYNLNLPRYIDSGESEDMQDIEGHLHGGIPVSDVDALSKFWDVFPTLKDYLFSPLREGYCSLNVPVDEVAFQISMHPEFEVQANVVRERYLAWENSVKSCLANLNGNDKPKTVICNLADKILDEFKDVSLMDKYDVYQVLLSYMNETMRDDLYLICGNGWESGRVVSYEYAKDKSGKKTEKVKSFDGLLLPKDILGKQFFPDDVSKIEKMQSDLDTAIQQISEIIEENSGEDGILSEVTSSDGKISLKDVQKRMKEIKGDKEADEYQVLDSYVKLLTLQSYGKRALKEEMEKLDRLIITKYAELTVPEIKTLVIEKKWFRSISSGTDALFDSVSHKLESRVVELAKRYETTLPECMKETDVLEKKVREDLEKMGYTW